MDFVLACDIMLDLEGSIRPALYLAEGLVEKGYKISMVSPIISRNVENYLNAKGIKPINLRVKLFAENFGLSFLWLEIWAREAFLGLNSRHTNYCSCIAINFSHTMNLPTLFWYLQGPTSAALKDMERELTTSYKYAYKILKPIIERVDLELVRRISCNSAFAVANSKFCASLYSKWGIKIETIIYPPVDCRVFHPTTSNPSEDYVLTYFGKETAFSVVKAIADKGVKIKAFGSKMPFVPKSVINHPNIDYLGRLSVSQLVNAYSNALFTLFTFTHEPFGYIPVESMACGTPTLTYDAQGPRESIVDGYTGWLVESDVEMIGKAVELWKKGIDSNFRCRCRKEALKFDKKVYLEKWLKFIANSKVKLCRTFKNGVLRFENFSEICFE
ncbi:MAG: glycosyltransferase [Candidatus Bathyarchaeia archaeon]